MSNSITIFEFLVGEDRQNRALLQPKAHSGRMRGNWGKLQK